MTATKIVTGRLRIEADAVALFRNADTILDLLDHISRGSRDECRRIVEDVYGCNKETADSIYDAARDIIIRD